MSEWAFWYLIKRHDSLWRFVVKYSPLIPVGFGRDLKRHVRSFLVTEVRVNLNRMYGYSDCNSDSGSYMFKLRRPILFWMKNEALSQYALGSYYWNEGTSLLRNIIKHITVPVKILVLVFSSAYTDKFKRMHNFDVASVKVCTYPSFKWKGDNMYDFVFVQTHAPTSLPPQAKRWLEKSKSLVVF